MPRNGLRGMRNMFIEIKNIIKALIALFPKPPREHKDKYCPWCGRKISWVPPTNKKMHK